LIESFALQKNFFGVSPVAEQCDGRDQDGQDRNCDRNGDDQPTAVFAAVTAVAFKFVHGM